MLHSFPNFILISGTDRNVGKTTFACQLISQFRDEGVTGLKISPHWHIPDQPENVIVQHEHYLIMEEKNRDGRKDSSRMLISGAKKVFYMQAADEFLAEAFKFLTTHVIGPEPVICESAALRRIIEPAAHFRVTRGSGESVKEPARFVPVDFFVPSSDGGFDFSPGRIHLEGNNWKINKKD
jgi:hypothetical protein